ncbi:MAG: ribosome small subunit-dependent GTPase A [Acidobacteriaceae bacterium]|nr:ribosome small subunit-dependent GTPase A [Acidobacteriaceae bacterium]
MNYSSHPLVRARVCEAAQEHYWLRFEDGFECKATPAGLLRWGAELPAVGDWVRARRADATLALIESVEPRATCISRQRPGGGGEQVLAANADLIVIVMGLDGDYNLRRLERYLVLAAASGAEAMVALNKADVCAEWPARLADARAIATHVEALSARASVTPILEAVRGRTVVLLGSSGAGKSTIANALLGESRQATQAVRERDSRGRHTTTRRMLVELPEGGALIDTPGLRELALWAGQESVDDVFDGIPALARQCRFHDCAHEGEPGCAVAAALETGELDMARWASYRKLLAEARYHERCVDRRAGAETKQKWKAIHKAMRHHPKYRR